MLLHCLKNYTFKLLYSFILIRLIIECETVHVSGEELIHAGIESFNAILDQESMSVFENTARAYDIRGDDGLTKNQSLENDQALSFIVR